MPLSFQPKVALSSFLLLGAVLWQYPGLADTQASDQAEIRVPIVFKPLVPYRAGVEISEPIRQECGLNEAMVASIQKYAKKHEVPLINDDPEPAQPGKAVRRLSAEITKATPGLYVFSAWHSKPAILTVQYRLSEGDNVILNKSRSCSSRKAGFLDMDGRACMKLKECVDEHGEYIGKWIKKTLY